MSVTRKIMSFGVAACVGGALAVSAIPANAAWKPTRNIEFIVPAGIGGGAGQMAQLIQGIIQKHNLIPTSMVVISKKGGSGAEGFLYVKNAKNDPHKLIITSVQPVHDAARDRVAVQLQGLHAGRDDGARRIRAVDQHQGRLQRPDRLYRRGQESPGKMKMGGTGSKQEDQIITAAIEQKTGAKFTYVPYSGGGAVATQLVGGHINSSVNNPIEAVAHWRAGTVTPQCVFDSKPMPYKEKITATMSWGDVPTCTSKGLPITYLMLRGVMTSPGVSQDVVDYYVGVMKKVRETAEWKDFMATGAFNQSFMTGNEFKKWLADAAAEHQKLMDKAGFLHKGS